MSNRHMPTSERLKRKRDLAAKYATRAAAITAEADALAEELRGARRFMPVSPISMSGPPHTTILFTRQLGGRTYRYAAVGWIAGDGHNRRSQWAVTGEESGRYTWRELLEFIEPENWRSIAEVYSAQEIKVRDLAGSGGRPSTMSWHEADRRRKAEADEAERRRYDDAIAGAFTAPETDGGEAYAGLVTPRVSPFRRAAESLGEDSGPY